MPQLKLITLPGLLLLSSVLAAQETAMEPSTGIEPGSARAQLAAFTEGLQCLTGRFEQQVLDADNRLVEQTEGQVFLRAPDQFRWDYQGEYPQQIIADGQHVWIHDIELEQVTVKPQSEMASDSPLSILVRPETLTEQFAVTEMGDWEDQQLLALEPLAEQAEFQRVILGFMDNSLRMMVLEDAFGQRTNIRFHDFQRSDSLDDDTFRFEAPPGADVIGDTGDGAVPEP